MDSFLAQLFVYGFMFAGVVFALAFVLMAVAQVLGFIAMILKLFTGGR